MSVAQAMNEELHVRTVAALVKASISPTMTPDDFALLCWHCGVPMDDMPSLAQSKTVRNQLEADFIVSLKGGITA